MKELENHYKGKSFTYNFIAMIDIIDLKKFVNTNLKLIDVVFICIILDNVRCSRMASALRERGIEEDDVVGFIAPNSPSIFDAHFGIPGSGAVVRKCIKFVMIVIIVCLTVQIMNIVYSS